MNDNYADPEPDDDDISLLLPWYVAGTLKSDDRLRVENYLSGHPDAADQLELIREEMRETVISNEALSPASRNSLDRLMAEISNDESSAPIFARAQAGFSQAIDGIFGMLSPSALRWSAAALVALLVGQAIVIGVLLGPGGNGPDQYRTATGQEGPVTTGTYVLVRFNDTATAQQINQFLDQENAVIVDGPKPGGLYKIRISESNFSQQELKERLEKILSYRGTIGRVFQTE